LNAVESKENVLDLWSGIEEITKIRPECVGHLTSAQIENLQRTIEEEQAQSACENMFTASEIFEKVFRLFDIIKEFIEDKELDVRSKNFEVIEVVWNFINACHADAIIKYKIYFKKVVDSICSFSPMLYQFMLTETLVLEVFQKCFTEGKKIIIFYLMENLYKRIQFSEDDDNLDAELRKRVFHCLRRYTETIKSCCNNAEFGYQVFSFIVRFYTSLIEEKYIEDFEKFFNAKCSLRHEESIFNARVYLFCQLIENSFSYFYLNREATILR